MAQSIDGVKQGALDDPEDDWWTPRVFKFYKYWGGSVTEFKLQFQHRFLQKLTDEIISHYPQEKKKNRRNIDLQCTSNKIADQLEFLSRYITSSSVYDVYDRRTAWLLGTLDSRQEKHTRQRHDNNIAKRSILKRRRKRRQPEDISLLYKQYLRSMVLTPREKKLQRTFSHINSAKIKILQQFHPSVIWQQWNKFQKQRIDEYKESSTIICTTGCQKPRGFVVKDKRNFLYWT